jgi:deoxyribodipyrimidine photo-lyase
VLYWQVMARRTRHNFALEHAVAAARAWGRPLVVLEALRAGYPWASDRLHRFALDGMHDNAAAYRARRRDAPAYVEPEPGRGRGLLEALAERACLVVTDEFPEFFLPRMLAAAGRKLAARGTRLELVDGNGLLPLRAAARRRGRPRRTSAACCSASCRRSSAGSRRRSRWRGARAAGARRRGAGPRGAGARRDGRRPRPTCSTRATRGAPRARALPIDHGVPPVPFVGGPAQGGARARDFLDRKLDTYATRRNEAEDPSNSGLSPYLHWGFVSVHEVFARSPSARGGRRRASRRGPRGSARGGGGCRPNAEAFLDEW